MANYVQGGFNTTENSYNLLVSGAPTGYATSSIFLGADTTTVGNGARFMFNNASQNANIDLRGPDISKNITFRYTTNGTAMSNMLTLANDIAMNDTTRHAATVGGRVNASSFYVNGNLSDTRAPSAVGMYMGLNGTTVAQFNVNKGASGSGGFSFNTYYENGVLQHNNMNVRANGQIQTVFYNATTSAADSEAVAIAGFDSNGNLVRNFAANQRFRLAESRLGAIECNLQNYIGPVPFKINEIISRLNGLNFFSSNINNITIWTPVTTTA